MMIHYYAKKNLLGHIRTGSEWVHEGKMVAFLHIKIELCKKIALKVLAST